MRDEDDHLTPEQTEKILGRLTEMQTGDGSMDSWDSFITEMERQDPAFRTAMVKARADQAAARAAGIPLLAGVEVEKLELTERGLKAVPRGNLSEP